MKTAGRRIRGMTLIELMTVLTLAGIVLSSIAYALHIVSRLDRTMRAEVAYGVVLPRLSRQLRADAHAAVKCEVPTRGEGPALLQQLSGERIEYHEVRGGMERLVVVDGGVARRALFRLSGAAEFSWEIDEPQPQRIRLRIGRHTPGAAGQVARFDLIEAAVGLDYRSAEPIR